MRGPVVANVSFRWKARKMSSLVLDSAHTAARPDAPQYCLVGSSYSPVSSRGTDPRCSGWMSSRPVLLQ